MPNNLLREDHAMDGTWWRKVLAASKMGPWEETYSFIISLCFQMWACFDCHLTICVVNRVRWLSNCTCSGCQVRWSWNGMLMTLYIISALHLNSSQPLCMMICWGKKCSCIHPWHGLCTCGRETSWHAPLKLFVINKYWRQALECNLGMAWGCCVWRTCWKKRGLFEHWPHRNGAEFARR